MLCHVKLCVLCDFCLLLAVDALILDVVRLTYFNMVFIISTIFTAPSKGHMELRRNGLSKLDGFGNCETSILDYFGHHQERNQHNTKSLYRKGSPALRWSCQNIQSKICIVSSFHH